MSLIQRRRTFAGMLTLAGAAAVVGGVPALADEGLPETTTIRLPKIPGICIAPGYVADDLLRAEGFTDVRFIDVGAGAPSAQLLARGELDFAISAGSILGSFMGGQLLGIVPASVLFPVLAAILLVSAIKVWRASTRPQDT